MYLRTGGGGNAYSVNFEISLVTGSAALHGNTLVIKAALWGSWITIYELGI